MERAPQLEWERRLARPAAAAAFAAVVLQVAGTLVGALPFRNADEGDRGYLRALDAHSGDVLISSVLRGVSLFAVAGALYYLYRCTKHRRQVPGFIIVPVLVAAPLLLATGAVLAQTDRIDTARDFTDAAPKQQPPVDSREGATPTRQERRMRQRAEKREEKRAEDALGEAASTAALATGLPGQLAFGFAYVLIGLNAMSAGLLSRFMGILGIIVGVLTVIPLLGQQPIVEIFWFCALGFLFLGLWPRGRGPAWDTGEAIPWPSAAEQAAAREEKAEEPPPEPEERPPSRKRKRKR